MLLLVFDGAFSNTALSQTISKTFTSNGSFTVPKGITSITIETWGGGGAGGGVSAAFASKGGGGGGGGGYNKISNFSVIPGNTYSITVGAGGSASSGGDGGDGGNSFIGSSDCLAYGGKGGKANNGAGGSGGNGLYKGGNGKNGSGGNSGGGGSSAGTGINGNNATGRPGASAVTGGGNGGDGGNGYANGATGGDPGGGGGGAECGGLGGWFSGGDGHRGKVIISYTVDACTTLYWAGENSGVPGGTSGTDFNTAANWSIDPNLYATVGFAPSSCNDVIISLQLTSSKSGTTITFSNTATTIKSLDFSVKNISAGSAGIYEGGLRLGNQSLTITNDITLYSENNFVNKTTQLTMDCTHDNSLYVYGGNLVTNAVNNGGGSGECIVYPFSNPVGTVNKGKFILKGNATFQGVGDDANPELNKPTNLVFDGTGTQTITNNNSNGYPIYLGFNTKVGESNSPTVIFTGSNALGFRSINNFTISNGASVEVEPLQSINRIGSGTPGTFVMDANSSLLLRGNNFPGGYATAYTLNASSTVEYGAANGVNQTIAAVSYGNLKMSNATGSGNSTKTLAANTTVKGNVTINGYATFDQLSYTCNRSASGGTLSLAANAVHLLAGSYPSNFSTVSLDVNSTTNYNGAAAQNIAGVNYGILLLSNSNNKTAAGNITVSGNFSILNSAIFLGSSYTHTMKGNWTNNSLFTANSSTITFSGANAQTIGGTAATQFNNLVINKTNNADIVSNSSKALGANQVTVTKGNLVFSATDNDYNIIGNVTVGPSGTLTHSVAWDTYTKALKIYGNLDVTGVFNPTVRSHVAMSGAGSKTIRTGDNPASKLSILTFSSGNYSANGKLVTNQEVWAMFGTGGSFSTSGNDVTFNSLINNNGTVNVNGGSLTVNNNAHVGYSSTPGIMNISAGNFNVGGSLFNYSTGSIVVTNSPQITVSGDWINEGVFTPGTSTTIFDGSVDENISGSSPLTFYNFIVSGTNVIQNMNLSVLNDLTVNSGILDMQTFTCNRLAAGGTMTIGANCMLKLRAGSGGATGSNFPANFSTYSLLSGSTVSYSGTVAQQIFATPSYCSLRLANAGIKTAGGNLTIRGNLDMENNNVFDGGSFSHKVGGNWNNNASDNAFVYNNSTVTFNGTTPQTIGGSYGTSFNAMVMDNTSGITISASTPVSVYESLTANGTGKSLTANDNLTLKSISTKTAWLGNMTGNTITGKATVERYVTARKAWRFISIPTSTTQTIKQAWQENALSGGSDPVPGYGTQITSELSNWASAGFDQKSYSPSMKYYDPANDKWIGVSSTNATQINNTNGYMIFVRGDRLSTSVGSPETQTNLRTKGDFKIGTQPVINVLVDKYASIGNPYPSPVDFTRINKGTGIQDVFYLWDPFLVGSYNTGGYQTYSAANGWIPVPGGTAPHPTGVASTIIQNGEAFFVHGKSSGSPADFTVQFTESAKVGVNPSPFARPMGTKGDGKRQFLRTTLINGAGEIADGNAVSFDALFSNEIDGDDAQKFFNGGENFGMKRNGRSLAVEARNLVNTDDTIFYQMTNLKKQQYSLQIVPVNWDENGTTAYLIDNYNKVTSSFSLADTFDYSFIVNNDAQSYAADRFKVVLSPAAVLPVSFITLSAIRKEDDILVKWSLATESNVKQYEIERSTDGTDFTIVGVQRFDAALHANYSWLDEQPLNGWNYYRIRSVDRDGKSAVSSVVKVNNSNITASVSVYPNPLTGKKLFIRFQNQPVGDYKILVLNDAGQQINSGSTTMSGNDHLMSINWNTNLPHGVYTIQITGMSNETIITRVKY